MAKDSFKYFRVEARELLEGLTQGVLQLEKGPFAPDVLAKLLRLAHTLKGAARVVRQPRIAELAHEIESVLATQREAAAAPTADQAAALLRFLDEITSQLRALDPDAAPQPARPERPAVEEPFETVRVEIQDMDSLLRDVTEAGVQLGGVRRSLAAVDRLRDLAAVLQDQLASRPGDQGVLSQASLLRARSITEDLRSSLDRFQRAVLADVERVDGELGEARSVAYRLRLVPARTVFPALDRAVRDAAQSLGRHAELETSGGDVRLDASVLAALRDALLHAVRNAVDHGVESDAARVAAGKPPIARVRLEVERRGNRVVFRCQDDGRGIDVDAVRAAAVGKGLIPSALAAGLKRADVIRLVFTGGLTTREDVTELSGRGIGLDVVRETVSRLKGEVAITSEWGRGTTLEMIVPVSLASFTGLTVEAAGTTASIPLDVVRETLRVRDADIAHAAGGDSILHDGRAVPFLSLEDALRRRSTSNRRRRTWAAVVVQSGGELAAVGVDRLLGTSNIVVRSLPGFVDADGVIAGVSLDVEGNPQLVLDPAGLVESARTGEGSRRAEAAAVRPPILVVDDSLTTRMLEKSILESAGYQVELATSAEEALIKVRDRTYGLFIVDVEMPGMDGFTFVAQTRADPVLAKTPAILVTSRNAPEDKRRGELAGARAYIVKSEFDQGHLLHTIRTLVG